MDLVLHGLPPKAKADSLPPDDVRGLENRRLLLGSGESSLSGYTTEIGITGVVLVLVLFVLACSSMAALSGGSSGRTGCI